MRHRLRFLFVADDVRLHQARTGVCHSWDSSMIAITSFRDRMTTSMPAASTNGPSRGEAEEETARPSGMFRPHKPLDEGLHHVESAELRNSFLRKESPAFSAGRAVERREIEPRGAAGVLCHRRA